MWEWLTLAHVCRRWRHVVFGSPIRLDLRIFCTERTPVRKWKSLDIWPEFPLALRFYVESQWDDSELEDNLDSLDAALEHCDRVREIEITSPVEVLWEGLVTAMEEPFPALRSLRFDSLDQVIPLPHTFLNGSASRLQHLELWGISFPSLPRLLSSTSDLTTLDLSNIPNSGYIPPETMATCLSALPKLKFLSINFIFRTPQAEQVSPLSTRFALPALTKLDFGGMSEYLEVLAARMDAPLLDHFDIYFSNQHQLVFDIPQIIRFLGDLKSFRSSSLELRFDSDWVIISSSRTGCDTCYAPISHSCHVWRISSKRLDCQVSSLAQICSQILPFCSSVNSLTLKSLSRLDPDSMDPTLWLQLFHSFPSVQSLTIPVALEQSIAAALQGLTGESVAEVFPSLHRLSIIGHWQNKGTEQGIESFIAARQHSGHPVALFCRG
jgi:hypothetical protein